MAISRAPLSALYLLAVFVCANAAAAPTCVRRASDTSAHPAFLCSVHASVLRLPGCSTRVVERLVFPHTVFGSWVRSLSLASGQRVASRSVSVRSSDGSTVPFSLTPDGAAIEVTTSKVSKPVAFVLRYTVLNGITKYTHRTTSSCAYDNAITGRAYNHKKWTLNLKDVHTADNVKVSFATVDKSATLRLAQGNNGNRAAVRSGKKTVSVTKRNVNLSGLEVAVLEEGTPLCDVEQGCSILLQGLERAEMSLDAINDGHDHHDEHEHDHDTEASKELGHDEHEHHEGVVHDRADDDHLSTKEPEAGSDGNEEESSGGGVKIGTIISVIGLVFIGVTLTIAFIGVKFFGES